MKRAASPAQKVEQRVMVRVMDTLRRHEDGAAVYTAFRKFLVEHASATDAEVGDAVTSWSPAPQNRAAKAAPDTHFGPTSLYPWDN
jgi:hypothetical protein